MPPPNDKDLCLNIKINLTDFSVKYYFTGPKHKAKVKGFSESELIENLPKKNIIEPVSLIKSLLDHPKIKNKTILAKRLGCNRKTIHRALLPNPPAFRFQFYQKLIELKIELLKEDQNNRKRRELP